MLNKPITIPLIQLVLTLISTLISIGSACAAADDATLFSSWQASLSKYVNNQGLVNYAGWKANRRDLDQFIESLPRITSADYNSMTRDEKLALWINTYNAFTLKQVLDHYPIQRSGFNLYPASSIRQIDGIWDKYKISVAGRTVSLHNIENDILRSEFKEPLIHFAINCASRSCPPLSNNAYTAGKLSPQLEHAASNFLQSPHFNRFDPTHKRVELSKIFEWYADDFVSAYFKKPLPGRSRTQAAVISFAAQYTTGEEKRLLESNDFSLSYRNYDWTLNDAGGEK